MAFRHTVRVRYGECDMQRIVHNAHYLAYCDDAVDTWCRSVLGPFDAEDEPIFDFMLKRATIDWSSAARFGDVLVLEVRPARWGRTSFDVAVVAGAGERPVFTASLVYVSVVPGTARPTPVPPTVRAALCA
jgi:acyl-CoA thioester hydrolase